MTDNDLLETAAEVSNQLQPSIFANIYRAAPLAARLVNDEVSAEEARDLSARIEALVNQSMLIQAEEGWLEAPHELMLVEHYRGVLLSAAALADPELTAADTYFARALAIDAEEGSIATNQLAPYTRFYFAGHLLQNGNVEAADSEISDLLDDMVTMNDTSPFVLFAKRANANPDSNNYDLFQLISNRSPEFKTFWADRFSLDF